MRAVAFVLVLASLTPAAAADPTPAAGERYYFVLFGGQGDVFRPRTAHTWATFVRTACTSAGEQVVAADTISWLPATLRVRPLARYEETGVNLPLDETMARMAGGRRSRVAVFGPYEVSAAVYQQALAQKALLESGAIRYHSLGLHGRRADVMHCVDGVTRMDAAWEDAASPSYWYGAVATAQAARAAVKTGIVPDPATTYPWLLPALNPQNYRLVPRTVAPKR